MRSTLGEKGAPTMVVANMLMGSTHNWSGLSG